MNFKADPPHVTLACKALSAQAAQELIASYLHDSASNAYLHPDALLTTSGVQYAPASGSQGGVILHNLRRVEAGLRGVILKPEPYDDQDRPAQDGTLGDTQEQAQNDEERPASDIDAQTDAVANGENIPQVIDDLGKGTSKTSKVDIEARKKAKKERERRRKQDKQGRTSGSNV